MNTTTALRLTLAFIGAGIIAGELTPSAAMPSRSLYDAKPKGSPAAAAKPKGDEKPFAELTKGKKKVEGLFTFYIDSTDQSVLMEVKPEQLGTIYLWNETRTGGDGFVGEGSLMSNSYPFCLKRVGKSIMVIEKNLRLVVDSTTPGGMRKLEESMSDGLITQSAIKSLPHDSSKAVLIDAAPLFVRDAENWNYFLNQQARTGLSFDAKASFVEAIKSFPLNSEITSRLHYKTNRPQGGDALQNPYSFYHLYHYSISTIPESDYVPRLADDRMGHYMTIFYDYRDVKKEIPLVRYINRWHLKKKDPSAALSEPVKPVVYWIENTVPEEYREAIKNGIEYWNQSLEKIGFKYAIQARQMPDTADWDPADIRYSVVRWSVTKNNPYAAIGPHRANPFTGEVIDADININADVIRNTLLQVERRVRPIGFDGMELGNRLPWEMDSVHSLHDLMYGCHAGTTGPHVAQLGLQYLYSLPESEFIDKDSLAREYLMQFMTFLVAHEVGHTLTFRHNFAASTINPFEMINDPAFAAREGTIGTVMDYPAPNIAGPGKKQGRFYGYSSGPWDDWMIAYTYSDFGTATPEEEWPRLKAIADRAGDPKLRYQTDEDTFANGPKGINPLSNWWDVGADVIEYYNRQIDISQVIWNDAIKKLEKPGRRYQDLTFAFTSAWQPYQFAATVVPKFIGGLYHSRMHVGDAPGTPFTPVSAADQRRAMQLLSSRIFAPNAFDLPSSLLNKLNPEQLQDFSFSAFGVQQVDFPIHQAALNVQNMALNKLYNPYTLTRLLNNTERVAAGEAPYTMYELFSDSRKAIWSELETGSAVNSFRRQLQLVHLEHLTNIFLGNSAAYPVDARSLASNDLAEIKRLANRAASSTSDAMTAAHCREVIRQIDAAQDADREYN